MLGAKLCAQGTGRGSPHPRGFTSRLALGSSLPHFTIRMLWGTTEVADVGHTPHCDDAPPGFSSFSCCPLPAHSSVTG